MIGEELITYNKSDLITMSSLLFVGSSIDSQNSLDNTKSTKPRENILFKPSSDENVQIENISGFMASSLKNKIKKSFRLKDGILNKGSFFIETILDIKTIVNNTNFSTNLRNKNKKLVENTDYKLWLKRDDYLKMNSYRTRIDSGNDYILKTDTQFSKTKLQIGDYVPYPEFKTAGVESASYLSVAKKFND